MFYANHILNFDFSFRSAFLKTAKNSFFPFLPPYFIVLRILPYSAKKSTLVKIFVLR